MPSYYLQGGDEYQELAYPKCGAQTFRVDSPYTLHWIDLNLKLTGKTPEVYLYLFAAGADHLPYGDPVSLSKYWLLNPPLPTRDWIWYEPWGKTLNENHYWLEQPWDEPPIVTLHNGAVTIVNIGRTANWIAAWVTLHNVPLVDADGKHIYFHHHSPISQGHPVNHWHSYTFKTEKDFDLWTLEGVISNGSRWPSWDTRCGETPLGSSFYCGQGPQVFDLTEAWIHCRTFHGLDPDPTGWNLTDIQLRVEDTEAAPGGTLTNNYVGFARQPYEPPPFDDYDVLPPGYTWPYRLYRVRFSMAKALLSPEYYYFLRATAYPGLLESAQYWQYDKSDSTYPQGIRLASADGGASWTKHFNDDHLFAAWGTPPAPPPPPPPPIDHWAILTIGQVQTLTGIILIVITNVPCHLFMYWTTTEPQRHDRTTIRRGLTVPDATQYCFVVWEQNEQLEPGDTIVHTFRKEPWAVCETRWFTFRATTDNEWSPSIGPIFKKHRASVPLPPITAYFYPDPHPESTSVDGYTRQAVSCPACTWADIHDGPGDQAGDGGAHLYLRMWAWANPNEWNVFYRPIMLFDTSSIPPESYILEADLRLYNEYNVAPAEWPYAALVIVSSNPALNWHLTPADYQTLGTTPLSNAIPIPSLNAPGHNIFTLNLAGKDAIIRGGITKLAFRENAYDRTNTPPPYKQYGQISADAYSTEHPDIEFRPRLRVVYMPP